MPDFLLTLTKEFAIVVTADSAEEAENAVRSDVDRGTVDHDWDVCVPWDVSPAWESPPANGPPTMGVVDGECLAIEDYQKARRKL